MAAGLLVAGSILSAYGNYKASEAAAEGLLDEANLLGLSAKHVLTLNDMNTQATIQARDELQGAAETQFAASGFATEPGAIADIASRAAKEIELNTLEAKYEATKMRAQASAKRKAAAATKKAGKIAAVGSILGGAGKLQ